MKTGARGRPEVGPRVQVRFEEPTLVKVDEFAAKLSVSRAEAVRRLVILGLAKWRGGSK